MKVEIPKVRILARKIARELTKEECDRISGAVTRLGETHPRTGTEYGADSDTGYDMGGEFNF
jgi:hypothetical protein